MSYMRGQQEHLALPDRHIVKIALIADLQHHVALKLIKKFLHGVVVIVGAFIRATDHLHGHVAVFEHLLVADWWLEEVRVLVDPFQEVKRFKPSALHGGPFRLRPTSAGSRPTSASPPSG